MLRRNYKLQDVYDYLMKYYNLEWRGYQIKDYHIGHNNNERGLRAWDFNSDKTDFSVIAIVYLGVRRKTVSLEVSNDKLTIYEVTPYLHHYRNPDVEWKQFLNIRYDREQILTK